MDNYSYVGNGDVNAIEDLYQRYQQDPNSIDVTWQKFFEGFEFAKTDFESGDDIPQNMHKEFKVINLINGYRQRGHLFTRTNPVRQRRTYSPTLDIANFDLEEKDLDTVFQAGKEVGLGKPATLREIIAHLESSYCESVGIEYTFIREPEKVAWIKERVESTSQRSFDAKEKQHILKKLSQATLFEQFLQKKFVGQKRFSLEGGDALIPALDGLIERAADLGAKEFVIGMAHRGRLNVLANIFNKKYELIFSEFEGKGFDSDPNFDGDVKYHLGHSCEVSTDAGHDIHMTLAPNPSHLEAVDPVVEGITRSKLDTYLKDENKIVPILIHGDAAIAGQGIVYEVVQMAQLDGYRVGGTVHIVINNQVGFTTNYLDARSSTYCTDVAKTTLSPVFHVNADDIEAVVKTVELAIEYRQKFKTDVFIDLLGYRKHGHNEGDEPKFTQPQLYKTIAKHPNPREIYLKQLLAEKVVDQNSVLAQAKEFDDLLQTEFDQSKKQEQVTILNFLENTWEGFRKATAEDFENSPETGVAKERLLELGKKLATLPEGKKYFRKIQKLFRDRINMLESDKLDWGLGEMLAYATLLTEGHPIRLSGQDVERGTFSHRHAVVKTEDDEEEIIPLNLLEDKQAKYSVYNSLLSEYGVLGFDYGYAMAQPQGLTIWEAQFGDFNNGAQIIIDQFLTAAEDKWMVQNGLVMLLPHGYEGMGAEHSSARLERYLTLCAENNIQVTNCTTPANFFHVLRRQIHREFRKPLINFSPKMLLRYPKAVSSISDFTSGGFQELIDDNKDAAKVKTIVFCSGKIYYEAIEQAESKGVSEEFAFVRLEQLYPLPKKKMLDVISKYANANRHVWLQEEPENMGAWSFILRSFREVNLEGICRPASGSPAAGSPEVHKRRHNELFNQLLSNTKELEKTI